MENKTKVILGGALLAIAGLVYWNSAKAAKKTATDKAVSDKILADKFTADENANPNSEIYVFLKDIQIGDYKFKKGDYIHAFVYEVQGNSCQSKGIGYAMLPSVVRTREDCYPLKSNRPDGKSIYIPYNSVEIKKILY